MGSLAELLGLSGDPESWTEGEAPARLATLAQGATQFLRAGGSVTLTEFGQLSLVERATLAVCADALRGEGAAEPGENETTRALTAFMAANNE